MPYTATYTFTLADFQALQSVIRSRQRFGYATLHVYAAAALLGGCVLAALGITAFGGRTMRIDSRLIGSILTIVVATCVALEVVFRLPVLARSSFKRQPVAGQSFTVVVHDAGLTTTGETQAGEWKWPAIKAVAEHRDAAFLMVSDTHAVVLPARGFSSPADYQGALALARSKVPAA